MEEAVHASCQRKEAQVAMELSFPRKRESAQGGEVSVLLVSLPAAPGSKARRAGSTTSNAGKEVRVC